MEFYSAYKPCATIPAPTGNGVEPVFELQTNKQGVKELVKVGETNLYEKIQASMDSCDVYSILKRYDAGDLSVLEKTKGVFGDFTQFPTSLAEAQQQVINAENMFNELPLEVRREFNHSYTEFLASFSNGTYNEKIAKFMPQQAQTTDLAQSVKTNDLNALVAEKQKELDALKAQTGGTNE